MTNGNYYCFYFLLVFTFVVLLVEYRWNFIGSNSSVYARIEQGSGHTVDNFNFVINNNLAQYSVYIILNTSSNHSDLYRIETLVQLNNKYIKQWNDTIFKCLLKLRGDKEVVQLSLFEEQKLYWKVSKKLVFQFSARDFKKSFKVEDLVIAVIRDLDYGEEQTGMNATQPYSAITYQKPMVLYQLEPRLPSVGICVHYTYQLPEQIFNWIDMHFAFGIAEIMFYDATDNQTLTRALHEKYGNDTRLTIRPFYIEFNDLCRHLDSSQNQSCFDFYSYEFANKYATRGAHEQVTANDCYTYLSQKHEFVAYYDLDEFIFPRTANFTKPQELFSCDSYSQICSLQPFSNDYSTSRIKRSYMYNYLHSIIENNRNGRSVSKLNSIQFQHAAYLIPNHIEKQLMSDLGKINVTKNTNFPLTLYLSEPPYNLGHTFTIEKKDVDYARYLHRVYKGFVPCVYEKYVKKIKKIDELFLRHLYFVTEGAQRMAKSIHYSRNVKSVFVHYATDTQADTWTCNAPIFQGHTSPHFRSSVDKIYKGNFTGSIRKLNVDLEYLVFLLKNFTNFCNINEE